jgi:hypothetical protein
VEARRNRHLKRFEGESIVKRIDRTELPAEHQRALAELEAMIYVNELRGIGSEYAGFFEIVRGIRKLISYLMNQDEIDEQDKTSFNAWARDIVHTCHKYGFTPPATLAQWLDTQLSIRDKFLNELLDASKYIRNFGDELIIAGYPGGDRVTTLTSLRQLIKDHQALLAEKKAQEDETRG